MEKTDIKSLDYDELKDFFVSIGEKPFRAKQVYQWMHEKQADGFEEMTNLSKSLREKLEENPAEPDHILTKWGVGYYFKG